MEGITTRWAGRLDAALGLKKEDFILWPPVFLGLGSGLYFSLQYEPSSETVVISLVMTAAAFIGTLLAQRRGYAHSLIFTLFVTGILTTAIGFGLAKYKTSITAAPVLQKEIGPVMIEGTISYIETLENERDVLFLIEDPVIEKLAASETPKLIRLTSRIAGNYPLGARVRILAKVRPPSLPVMPDAYNFRRHYFFQGIGGIGFSLRTPELLKEPDPKSKILEHMRMDISEKVRHNLEPRLSGIASALITGERAAIQKDDWNALRASGLAHIISISGLHVALVATSIFYFSRLLFAGSSFLALHYPIKKWAAMLALIAATAYVLFVVPSVPTYRALLMTGIGLVAIMFDRSPFSLRLLAVAAIIILILSPESIWSASFQLSFAAVLSLIVTADAMRPYYTSWRQKGGVITRSGIYLLGSIITTLVVSIITAPLASFHFQQIPLYGVLSNAISIPLSGLIIMPGVVMVFALWPFNLQDIAIKFMGVGIDWMLVVAHSVAEMPYAVIQTSAWPYMALYFMVACGLGLVLLPDKKIWILALLVIAGGIMASPASGPVLLLSESGKLLGIKSEGEIYLSSLSRDKFTAETWEKNLGIRTDNIHVLANEGNLRFGENEIICGEDVCRIEIKSKKITFGTNMAVLAQDCEWADLILTSSSFRQKNCQAEIYNRFRLSRTGALTIAEDGTVKTVRDIIGFRPWNALENKFSDNCGLNSKAHPESARGPPSGCGAYKRRFPVRE